jgi:DNA-binding transcriptional LysR family regulator
MLEIKPLSYFIAAYEEKSISAAAARCFIAQPSISHAIKNLEHKLKQNLFIRSKSGLTPTPYGVKLYKNAKSLIDHANNIEHDFINTPSIAINIFFQGDIGLQDLNPIIKQLTQSTPVSLHRVSEMNQSDIAFIDHDQIGKRFESIHLFHEGFSVLMRAEHPLAKKSELELNDIQNQTFIERPYCSRRNDFLSMLKQHKLDLNMEAKADNDLQVIELVALGFGLAALPSRRLSHIPDGIVAKPINLAFQREVILAHRSSRNDITQLLNTISWEWVRNN